MSPKTDPFLPVPAALETTKANLEVFQKSNVFLMCQTRSAEVIGDPRIIGILAEMATEGRVGVSFSIGTDILAEQRRIERGGLPPEQRLDILQQLKSLGIFVSAAIAPIMPFSPRFAERIVSACHHASMQGMRVAAVGSSTPGHVVESVLAETLDYRGLTSRFISDVESLHSGEGFSWGVGNKGFIGAFLAAKRYYGIL